MERTVALCEFSPLYIWALEGMSCVTMAHDLVHVSEALCPLRPFTEQDSVLFLKSTRMKRTTRNKQAL